MSKGIEIKENVSIKPFTTLDIGGPARYFAEIANESDIPQALHFCKSKKIPFFILGGGSNVVVADSGFNGLVLHNKICGMRIEKKNDETLATIGAGEIWDNAVAKCLDAGLSGMEFLSGIPGTAGAAPVQNIGAYGRSASSIIKYVSAFDTEQNKPVTFTNPQCRFGYRTSIFKNDMPGRFIITGVCFKLVPGGRPELSSYHEIQKYFADWKNTPTLSDIRNAVTEIRSRKGMVIDAKYVSYKSVGSFFLNPVVTADIFLRIEKALEQGGPNAKNWFYKEENSFKISAALLIEQAGFPKGYRMGEAGISPKHALALINYGKAKSMDIIALARRIKSGVLDKFGISLEAEAQFIGFDRDPFL